jgi:hypothetical protein
LPDVIAVNLSHNFLTLKTSNLHIQPKGFLEDNNFAFLLKVRKSILGIILLAPLFSALLVNLSAFVIGQE